MTRWSFLIRVCGGKMNVRCGVEVQILEDLQDAKSGIRIVYEAEKNNNAVEFYKPMSKGHNIWCQ